MLFHLQFTAQALRSTQRVRTNVGYTHRLKMGLLEELSIVDQEVMTQNVQVQTPVKYVQEIVMVMKTVLEVLNVFREMVLQDRQMVRYQVVREITIIILTIVTIQHFHHNNTLILRAIASSRVLTAQVSPGQTVLPLLMHAKLVVHPVLLVALLSGMKLQQG